MLTQSRLIELLEYNPDSGVLVWLRDAGRYGRIKAGTEAGFINRQGYRIIVIDGVDYKAHRLAWLYVKGAWPEGLIDHLNRDKSDNRLRNLREASGAQNRANIGLQKNNTSGHRGAIFNNRKKKYQARLGRQSLGYFADPADAGAAALAARIERYGEYAA